VTLETYLGFLAISFVVIIVPAPNVTLILATSALQGMRSGFMALLRTTIAQAIQLTLVAFGLVWLVRSYSAAFELIRYIGAAYLVYLGIKAWRSASEPLPDAPSDQKTVRKGFLVGLANPKSLTFFAAFFPQFINPSMPAEPQFAMLAIGYAVLALVLDAGYVVAGGYGNRLLATNRSRLWLGRGSGIVLAGGGLLLAGADRK